MNIGFDAKRAFHNETGLGHYSRSLIGSLASNYPEYQYFLFNPKPSSRFSLNGKNIHEVGPSTVISKLFSSVWRSHWIKKDLHNLKIDLYHGLSHEIPYQLHQTKIKSVVTIHDLIFERYPDQYSKIDIQIYRQKFKYACRYADGIIASSEQTKNDIIEFYKCEKEKITTCYQSCNPIFSVTVSEEEKKRIRKKYNLPEQYFLYVGSIVERKNLLIICKAIQLLGKEIAIPLVVIGHGNHYRQIVKKYLQQHNLLEKIIFLSDNEVTKTSKEFLTVEDFPGIYQSATAMIYPSHFEGFGIPILEALWSRLPVITSNVSCMPEVGGDAVYYVNPNNENEIAAGMKEIFFNNSMAESLKEKGWMQAQKFLPQVAAASVMNVYNSIR